MGKGFMDLPQWHRNSLQGPDTWFSSLRYPQHLQQSLLPQRCHIGICWMNEVHSTATGFLNGWAHTSLLFIFLPLLYKKFSNSLWACGGFSKRQIVLLLFQRIHCPPPNQSCLSLFLIEREAQLALQETCIGNGAIWAVLHPFQPHFLN